MSDSLDLDAITEAPSYRRPGDYRRRGPDGPPFVLDPTGSRTRRGKIRSLLYGRPSGFHRWIENGYALERWSERMVLVGLCRLVAGGELELDVELDVDLEDPKVADELVARAKHVAGADLSAARGTAAHEATHRLHDLERAELDVLAGLEELGFTPELVDAILLAYEDALARWGLEVLASEVKVVDDVWRLAGTADRFVRLTRDLRFGDVVIPAGTIVVLDLKTGALRVKGGEVLYWSGYAVQLRSYAHGCLYVIGGDEERREPFPWPVDTSSGLILHVDIAGALETDVVAASLWWVDLEHGRALGELACLARDAASIDGVFVQCGEGPLARTVEVDHPTELELELAASLDAAGVPLDPRLELRAWLQDRIDVVGRHSPAAATDLSRAWPAGVAALRTSDEHSDDELAAIEAALNRVETDHSVPFGPSRPGRPSAEVGWLSRLLDAFPNTTIHETRLP
jgi:hypothetical protein